MGVGLLEPLLAPVQTRSRQLLFLAKSYGERTWSSGWRIRSTLEGRSRLWKRGSGSEKTKCVWRLTGAVEDAPRGDFATSWGCRSACHLRSLVEAG